jgi:hypothetical protein
MYVTVRRYTIIPGSAAELNRRIQDEFLPIINKLPGFVEYFWISAGDKEMFSVSVFTDRAGSADAVRAAAEYVKRNLTSLLPYPPNVMSGDVIVHQARSDAERAA